MRSIADTSRIAYSEQKDMGNLARRQKQILEFLADHPNKDFTRKELSLLVGLELSTICGRVNELLDPIQNHGRAWLDELPVRKCRLSGKSAHPVRIHRPVGQLDLFRVAA